MLSFLNHLSQVQRQDRQIFQSIESEQKGVRQDIDEEDNEESYYRYMEENPNAGKLVLDIFCS